MFNYFKTAAGLDKFFANRDGATAIEYGLIAGLIAVAIVAAITTLGGNLTTLFGAVSTKVTAATPAA